jgi:signal transduction histidine kinase
MPVAEHKLDLQTLIDGLPNALLVFDDADRLVTDNQAARDLLGADFKLLRAQGWQAAAALFDTRLSGPEQALNALRESAHAQGQPQRCSVYRAGEQHPCVISAIKDPAGTAYTLVTIERPDWSALSELAERYLVEVREAVETTSGHARLITQAIERHKPKDTVEQIGKRINGFTRIISTHMQRLGLLTGLMFRLEEVRTGQVHVLVKEHRREIALAAFMEDFLEDIDGSILADPETEGGDHRRRIELEIPDDVTLWASPNHLAVILRDVLRNAIMYSMKATPIRIVAHAAGKDRSVQVDIRDEGYGIRSTEVDRVFVPFTRSRQPQVMAEFGYGLSLYLCKHEIEAMNGRIWFESEEGVGTRFSLKLPAAPDGDDADSAPATG